MKKTNKLSPEARERAVKMVQGHREIHWVELKYRLLQIAPSAYRTHAALFRDTCLLSHRAQRDAVLMPTIERVWNANMQVYGANKVWMQLNREGEVVARCTVERLM